jgi:hypothetical protein
LRARITASAEPTSAAEKTQKNIASPYMPFSLFFLLPRKWEKA